MFYLDVPTTKGVVRETVYNIDDFPYYKLHYIDKCRKGKKASYYNIATAFDIETTTQYRKELVKDVDKVIWQRAFMYHWQICIDKDVVFGRTWEEFIEFLERIREHMNLNDKNRLCIYVHNLPYEFQFMKEFINIDGMFSKDKRKPLKISSYGIEFRCSYALSNMNLYKFCQNSMLCTHYKLQDDFDYSIIRTPKTELTETEQAYCYNDVRGLCEAIDSLLLEDTIATIPLTNTGYVRREYRENMKTKQNRYNFVKTQLSPDEYLMLRKAFIGGNTHASRFFSNRIIDEPVYSYDIQSSYPACMMLDDFPMGKFTKVTLNNQDKLNYYVNNYCVVMDISIFNVIVKDNTPIPYLSISHCTEKANILNDNGRVLKADYIRTTITNIDLEIIRDCYNYEGLIVHSAMYAKRGKLPIEFRNTLLNFYEKKTKLKGIDGKEYEYNKSKNRINSSFGMCVTDLLHDEHLYTDGEWETIKADVNEAIEKFYKSRNNFLSYQWGIFTTANARKRLQYMLKIVGNDVVYTDTDSIKFINSKHIAEFEQINKELIKQCEKNDIRAYADKDGERYYLGIWDKDGVYTRFKTLGAKKYAYEYYDKKTDTIKFMITVAGMNKDKGSKAIKTIDNFTIGQTFYDIDHNTSWYNDSPIHKITVNGDTFTTASNIAIVETEYTLGITNEYWNLLNITLDNVK